MMWNCKSSRRKQGQVFLTLNFGNDFGNDTKTQGTKAKIKKKKSETTYLI